MSDKLRVLDLFSGIGGFSLGLERTGGFETVAFCEIDPFCRRVLAKHWPNVRQYEDVRTLTADALFRDGITVDVITGGFPCQDISIAGKGAGINGSRSGLWHREGDALRPYADSLRSHSENLHVGGGSELFNEQERVPGSVAWWRSEPDVARVVDGVPSRMDIARIRATGNAVVPQIPEIIGRAIIAARHEETRR
jgi:hypothetical protein